MSEPRRWDLKVDDFDDCNMVSDPKGEYVLFEDYARLKAEVERLRKAGDDMAFYYQEIVRIVWGQTTTNIPPSVIQWNAAKEGKPSV